MCIYRDKFKHGVIGSKMRNGIRVDIFLETVFTIQIYNFKVIELLINATILYSTFENFTLKFDWKASLMQAKKVRMLDRGLGGPGNAQNPLTTRMPLPKQFYFQRNEILCTFMFLALMANKPNTKTNKIFNDTHSNDSNFCKKSKILTFIALASQGFKQINN